MKNENKIVYPGIQVVKVTCVVPQEGSTRLHRLIENLGISEMTVQQSRRTLLCERRIRLRDSIALSEELMEIVQFYIPPAWKEWIMSSLIGGFGFGEPGSGSIVSQRVNLVSADLQVFRKPLRKRPAAGFRPSRNMAGLSCIVPRGEGTVIARVALKAGLCAPVITYARGVGTRTKLGLIRVTIPAEKEIVTIFLSRHDIGEAFRMVNEVMHLNRPGAGFFYWFPIDDGILDTRIWIGRQPHVASMEQVIAAIDVVTGDTTWRRKAERASSRAAVHPVRLAGYMIHGTEGDTEPIVNSAQAAGAGGATLSRVHRETLRGTVDAPSACESSKLIIPKSLLPRIHGAVNSAGLIEQRGFIEIAEVGGASGYRTP